MKTPMFSSLSILALLLLLAACSIVDPADDAALDEEPRFSEGSEEVVVVQEGQRVAVPSFEATLTFVEKAEDSRCPSNVVCFWEGEAKILLEFALNGQAPVSFEMAGFVGPDGHDQAGQGLTHEAFGLRFTLLRLDPYPLVDVEQTDPVTATIRVEVL